ncbi:hypothetical protein CVT26_010206 [Gymnopilus dilepis]|uniref:Uncharacterized protein n=1 Tax=Gymnopilus dilepis TaxID=231916 RepID=A0A409W4L7_9AGAR|nr:hypothetical protein CVT26_010206 [Gymnopilus dilepis]
MKSEAKNEETGKNTPWHTQRTTKRKRQGWPTRPPPPSPHTNTSVRILQPNHTHNKGKKDKKPQDLQRHSNARLASYTLTLHHRSLRRAAGTRGPKQRLCKVESQCPTQGETTKPSTEHRVALSPAAYADEDDRRRYEYNQTVQTVKDLA